MAAILINKWLPGTILCCESKCFERRKNDAGNNIETCGDARRHELSAVFDAAGVDDIVDGTRVLAADAAATVRAAWTMRRR